MKARHIALIGMSNIGKSHWSRRLASEAGYKAIDCDEQIRVRLDAMLPPSDESGVARLATWMGTPDDSRYAETSRRYLEAQNDVIDASLTMLASDDSKPAVLDTPGSVVYADPALLARMKSLLRIVYLEAPANAADAMFERFQNVPKPLIWRNAHGISLKERYVSMLEDRASDYRTLADVTIPYAAHAKPQTKLGLLLG